VKVRKRTREGNRSRRAEEERRKETGKEG